MSGNFTSIDGQPRQTIAALDRTTGKATAWNPQVDWPVLALAVQGSAIYAVGMGSGRDLMGSGIAAFDTTTGEALPWHPTSDYGVLAVAVDQDTVYVGGSFDCIDWLPHAHIAALKAPVYQLHQIRLPVISR